jgi:hypothetical protein
VIVGRLNAVQRLVPHLGKVSLRPEQRQPIARALPRAAHQLVDVDTGGLAGFLQVEPHPALAAGKKAREEAEIHVDDRVAVLGEVHRLHRQSRA